MHTIKRWFLTHFTTRHLPAPQARALSSIESAAQHLERERHRKLAELGTRWRGHRVHHVRRLDKPLDH